MHILNSISNSIHGKNIQSCYEKSQVYVKGTVSLYLLSLFIHCLSKSILTLSLSYKSIKQVKNCESIIALSYLIKPACH